MIKIENISNDLFNKIRGRFPSVTIGDQDGTVTNKPEEARFFEFDFSIDSEKLGKVTASIKEENEGKLSLVLMFSEDFITNETEDRQDVWYNFLRELRIFSKKRLMNFEVRNINKDNLKKSDYRFLAQRHSGDEQMTESRLYGTSRISYENIGDARLMIKHTKPVNTELAAGRTQHIGSIYVENSQGERFKYPHKHLSGARALARHVSEGGNPYDDFGSHITEMSSELSKLRRFNTHVNRNSVMAETLSAYKDVVKERVEEIKNEIKRLQKETYYREAVENFVKEEVTEVPEDVKQNWIDELTMKTFNEDLVGIFPYLYKLVQERNTLGPDDLVSEDDDPCWKGYKQIGMKKKGGKKVPNCVPEEAELESAFDEMMGQFAENKKPEVNFTADDLQKLQRIKDLKKAKEFALDLITKNSLKPMQPKKVSWFQRALDSKKSVMDIVKMMYDMMLSGEGNSVIGTTKGMSPNSYRQKFKDSDGKDSDDKETKESKTPLSEFILSYFDRNTGTFPKGETAVLTMIEKDYGEQFIEPAKDFIERINHTFERKQLEQEKAQANPEFDDIKRLAGV